MPGKSSSSNTPEAGESGVRFNRRLLQLFRGLREVADRENHLEKFLEETARLLGQTFGHGRVTFFLYDEETQELYYLRGWINDGGEIPTGYRQKITQGLMGKAIRNRSPLVVQDVSSDKDFIPVPGLKAGSEACFPITFRNEILGLLDIIDRRKRAFKKEEIDFLSFLVRFLGSALAERQKARALTTQAEKTTLILDGMRDGYYEVDLKGRFTFVNKALARAWGRSREEMIGRSYRDFLLPESVEQVFSVFNEVFRSGRAKLGVQAQVRDVDGQLHIIEFSVALIRNEQGEPVGFYGIVHDVTDRVWMEQELREANARFASLLEALPDVIYFKDLEGRNLIVNRAMEELTGLTRERIIGKRDEEIFPPELALKCRQSDAEVLKQKKSLRFYESLNDSSGRRIYFETIKSPVFDKDGNLIGIVGISRNITGMKEAEERLKESERSFRSLFENATVGIYRTSPDGRILLANPAMVRMLGYESFEELAARNLEKDGFEPSYPRRVFIEQIEKYGELRGLEAAWRRKDGSIIYVRESARAIRDENGNTLYYEGVVEDITEKKEAEVKLRAQQELFQTVLNSAEDIIFILDKNYRILLLNRAAQEYFEVSAEEAIGKVLAELYKAESWSSARERFERVLRGEIVREDVSLYYKGRKIILSVTEVPLRNKEGEIYGLCGIARDITQRVRMEQALMESVKEKEALLREIHHRVKNNMQVICSLLNLQAYHSKNSELTSILKDCQSRIRSMAIVHEQLYRSANLAKIDFAGYLEKLVVHLYNAHRQSQEKVSIETQLQPVELDIGKAMPLGLMASEIISNCFKHAFPGERRGKLKVVLSKIEPSGMKLEISDDGVGLPEDFSPGTSKSFGMELIELLRDQLGARLEVDRTSGTRYLITIT